MKILHVLYSDRFSGAENVVCQIVGIFRNTENVEMVYCSRDGQIREALEERNVTFAPVSELSVAELKRVIQEQKPDVIHAHDMRASFVAAMACGKIPLISHIHNNNFDSRGISPKSIAYLFAAIKAKHIFWVSQNSFEGYCFHQFFGKKSSVLVNIIDMEALNKKKDQDQNEYFYDVAYVGRLSPEKNPLRLMDVCANVLKCLPDVNFAVVGTGELEDETKRRCEELGIQSNVHFLGFQSNPLKILHEAKVMVMTSNTEGIPMCALEAMALGVPIVSTPVGGMVNLVDDGDNGYLRNDANGLAERIVAIIDTPELYEKLSANAKERAEKINDVSAFRNCLHRKYMDSVR